MSENNQVKKSSFIVIAIVALLALIVFAAFKFLQSKGNRAILPIDQKTTSATDTSLVSKSKLAKIFNQNNYSITYVINDPETNTVLEILFMKDGDKMFSRSTYNNSIDQESSILIIGSDYYSIDHINKTIYHNQAAAEEGLLDFIADDYQDDTLITGQETIADITYDTEDFGDGSVFYFLNDQLKMIKEKESNTAIIVKDYSLDIDRSLFVLPSDYKMEEEENRAYNTDEAITEEDLEALKAQGVEINLDELNSDANSLTDD